MRGRLSLLLIACLAGGSSAAAPADPPDGLRTHYWPRRNFDFPVDPDKLARLPDPPAEIALFASYNRAPFRQVAKYDPAKLPRVNGGRTGFPFEADKDGEYEFAIQFVYRDGRVAPRPEDMAAERRVVIDTLPPTVRVAAVGNGVEWVADDDNLDPRTVALQCKFPSDSKWFTVPPVRGDAFQPTDHYAWKLQPGQQLDVRVQAKDKAGHEGVSRVVRVPGSGAGGLTPRDPLVATSPDWPPRGPEARPDPFGGPPPQTQIYYVNALDFHVDTAINRMGRSGVKAAHLFVSTDKRTWKPAPNSPFKLAKKPEDEDRSVSLPFKADKEGVFGFIVVPESGAGKRAADPVPDAPAMVQVVVDTTPPYVKITSVEVLPGDARGPRVDISWKSDDPNPMPRPVSIEYSLDKAATHWQPVALQVENNLGKDSGRYSWYVPDEKLWRFWVRIRAVDKAGNTGEHVYEQEVLVDLERPEAAIKAIQTHPVASGSPARPPGVPPIGRPPEMPLPAGSQDRPTPPSLDP